MDEDKDKRYVIRPVVNTEPDEPVEEAKAVQPVTQASVSSPPAKTAQGPQQVTTKQRMQFPKIPTDRIIKTVTNRDMMMETLHDETMEPHIHLAVLLLIVIILAIIISLIGL